MERIKVLGLCLLLNIGVKKNFVKPKTFWTRISKEEWLKKLYDSCPPTDSRTNFLMPSEMLTKINAWSGMRLSIKKLSTAMRKLGYGKTISKRHNGNPRKVYPVIERSEMDEDKWQRSVES